MSEKISDICLFGRPIFHHHWPLSNINVKWCTLCSAFLPLGVMWGSVPCPRTIRHMVKQGRNWTCDLSIRSRPLYLGAVAAPSLIWHLEFTDKTLDFFYGVWICFSTVTKIWGGRRLLITLFCSNMSSRILAHPHESDYALNVLLFKY